MNSIATADAAQHQTEMALAEYGLGEPGLGLLFRDARTHTAWQPRPVSAATLREVYDLAKMGPTSANTSPLRIAYLVTDDAKARLLPALAPQNVEKSRTAAAVALLAYDTQFYDELPRLFPHADARAWFAGNEALAQETAFRNSSLQGGYFILAARALGLDCGPMSGFDPAQVNAEFFPDGRWQVNFICNLGYGDARQLYPRSPRLTFDEACVVL